jgi:hypothetical protein
MKPVLTWSINVVLSMFSGNQISHIVNWLANGQDKFLPKAKKPFLKYCFCNEELRKKKHKNESYENFYQVEKRTIMYKLCIICFINPINIMRKTWLHF